MMACHRLRARNTYTYNTVTVLQLSTLGLMGRERLRRTPDGELISQMEEVVTALPTCLINISMTQTTQPAKSLFVRRVSILRLLMSHLRTVLSIQVVRCVSRFISFVHLSPGADTGDARSRCASQEEIRSLARPITHALDADYSTSLPKCSQTCLLQLYRSV